MVSKNLSHIHEHTKCLGHMYHKMAFFLYLLFMLHENASGLGWGDIQNVISRHCDVQYYHPKGGLSKLSKLSGGGLSNLQCCPVSHHLCAASRTYGFIWFLWFTIFSWFQAKIIISSQAGIDLWTEVCLHIKTLHECLHQTSAKGGLHAFSFQNNSLKMLK